MRFGTLGIENVIYNVYNIDKGGCYFMRNKVYQVKLSLDEASYKRASEIALSRGHKILKGEDKTPAPSIQKLFREYIRNYHLLDHKEESKLDVGFLENLQKNYADTSRLGSNLNQLIHHFNIMELKLWDEGKKDSPISPTKEEFDISFALLKELKEKVESTLLKEQEISRVVRGKK